MSLSCNDLRIGNIVTDKWKSGHVAVDSMNNKGINLEITDDGNWPELACHYITPEYDFDELHGVELTEDILSKCGFIKNHNYGTDDDWYWSNGIIDLTDNLRLSLSDRCYDSISVNSSKKFKYLHELQNIQFALTGKELELTF